MSIWAITSYFNPEKYKIKYENYLLFREKIRENNIPLLTVECSFTEDFELDDLSDIIKIKSKDVMWLKEQLLNIALNHLPRDCDKFVWLDCDIYFENENWAKEINNLLNSKPILQPFSTAYRLPCGHREFSNAGEYWNSFASVYARVPNLFFNGNFDSHGHSGFVWAARREIFSEHGLYDACIIGSGDHAMSHAFAGDWASPCIKRIFGGNKFHILHFQNWAKKVYPKIKAKIGYLEGSIYHLWHGETENRKYVSRNKMLANLGFEPDKDIYKNSNGLYEWTGNKPELKKFCKDYFAGRKEDSVYDIRLDQKII
jgi:hypothetical protein